MHQDKILLWGNVHQKKMLPGNFPKFCSFLVNAAPKFGGIELDINVGEPLWFIGVMLFVELWEAGCPFMVPLGLGA
jgi:hypothetical protein